MQVPYKVRFEKREKMRLSLGGPQGKLILVFLRLCGVVCGHGGSSVSREAQTLLTSTQMPETPQLVPLDPMECGKCTLCQLRTMASDSGVLILIPAPSQSAANRPSVS